MGRTESQAVGEQTNVMIQTVRSNRSIQLTQGICKAIAEGEPRVTRTFLYIRMSIQRREEIRYGVGIPSLSVFRLPAHAWERGLGWCNH